MWLELSDISITCDFDYVLFILGVILILRD